ncbi:btk-binding protein-related [Anaeramoeba flamelloides]|uniref:Btk-binding protein-related n=1 Tax=Anaeramoeba flamelloides TaxID=1746091 RepID=A0ABQ8ZCA2_9EUKA|nr:btk-binding protein-related [Anaeramoeba flamelloides]
MSYSSSVYLTGSREYSFVTQKKNNNLPKWTESSIKKTQTIKKIVCGGGTHFLVWKKPNKLEFYQENKKRRKYQLPNGERIKDIVSGYQTYQILTESGKVWSLADNTNNNLQFMKEVPLLDADQSTFEKIRYVTFFEEKKLFVNSVVMGSYSCYYLCNGDQLYASGSNSHGRLGIGKEGDREPMPVYVQDKVTKIFAGSHAFNFFFITSKADLLYACGNNKDGKLGVGYTKEQRWIPTVVRKFKGSEILTISSGVCYTILINKKGQTYSCGYWIRNGHGVRINVFILLPKLKGKKAVQLATGFRRTLVLTDQNELYGWGFENDKFPTDKIKSTLLPTKISLPGFFTNYLGSKDMIRIASGSNLSFLYLDFKNTLPEDLRILYKSKKFCDCEIGTLGNQIPVHKSLIEFRTKLTIDQIQNKLFGEKPINKEQTLNFLKWIYYDEISDIEKLEQTFNLLELTYPPSVDNTLEKDIAQLYKDDDSKDFKILVKIDDEDQEEENDDEEDLKEGNYEEIPVHKFILYARSGLFRAMFDYVNEKENTNKVQDYTNKSIKSLKILIKYFYTNSIELTTNQDPKLIVDELSDAVEYYQLNDQCNLENELLKKLKKATGFRFDLGFNRPK